MKVERVGEPADGFDIFRIRVWTVDKKGFSILPENGVSLGGTMQLEKETKLFRGEARLIISCLAVLDDGKEVETWVHFSSTDRVSSSRLRQRIPRETPWSRIVDIAPRSGVYKIEQRLRLGKINGKPLEIEID
jgi:hypothetical protein